MQEISYKTKLKTRKLAKKIKLKQTKEGIDLEKGA